MPAVVLFKTSCMKRIDPEFFKRIPVQVKVKDQAAFIEALKKLPPELERVFSLRYIQTMPWEHIAENMGMAFALVRKCHQHALWELKRQFEMELAARKWHLEWLFFKRIPIALDEKDQDVFIAAMDKLPPGLSQAFRMRYMDDMPVKAIAAALQLSQDAVRGRVRNAVSSLEKEFVPRKEKPAAVRKAYPKTKYLGLFGRIPIRVDQKERGAFISAMESLPELPGLVFFLRWVDNLPVNSIAAILGFSPNRIYNWLGNTEYALTKQFNPDAHKRALEIMYPAASPD